MLRFAIASLMLVILLLTGCSETAPSYETSVVISPAKESGKLAIFTGVKATSPNKATPDSGFRIFSIAPGEEQTLALDNTALPGRRYIFKLSVSGTLSTPTLHLDTSVLENDRVLHRSFQNFTPMGIGPNNSFKRTAAPKYE
jgi:hypothetical protein